MQEQDSTGFIAFVIYQEVLKKYKRVQDFLRQQYLFKSLLLIYKQLI